jgi:hypothetical protein
MFPIRAGLLFPVLLAAGCAAAPERAALPPRPVDGKALPFETVLFRARYQASTATDAFLIDNWDALFTSAKSLEESAADLKLAENVPAARKASLSEEVAKLTAEAKRLQEAAKAKDAKAATEPLQRIQLQIRTLNITP